MGLPDKSVQESKNRVQAAIKNAKLHYPRSRLVVNLAPAIVRKEDPFYDLPIALGVLITGGVLPQRVVEGTLVIGELSLDGTVRHARRAAHGRPHLQETPNPIGWPDELPLSGNAPTRLRHHWWETTLDLVGQMVREVPFTACSSIGADR